MTSAIEASSTPAVDSRGKGPAWSVPPNGANEASTVMDAASWPALSKSAKASANSPSSGSLKHDGSASAPPRPLVSSSYVTRSLSPNPIQNTVSPSHQKTLKDSGGSRSNSGSSSSMPIGLPLPPAMEIPVAEPSPRGFRNGGIHFGGNRRVPTVGGSHHRHDQEWNHHRNPQLRGGFRSFPRGRPPTPPISPPIMGAPLPIRPFPGNPMGFHDVPPPPIYIVSQPQPMPFFPYQVTNAVLLAALDSLRAKLLHQIEYYFSDDNLPKDEYLRRHMDNQGWVSISVIAGFKRVMEITNQVMQLINNIQFILDTMRLSTVVEVQGERIRRRNNWRNYLLADNVTMRLTSLNIEG